MQPIDQPCRTTPREVFTLAPLALLSAVVLFSALDLFWWQLRNFTTVPFGDMIDTMTRLYLFLTNELGLRGYFFAPSNEHIIATGRVIFWLDWHLAKGTGLFAVACSYLILSTLAITMTTALFRWSPALSWPLRATLACMLIGLWLNGAHLMNLNWSFQVQHWIVVLLAWVAVLLFIAIEGPGSTRRRNALHIALVAIIALACMSIGTGIVVLPVLIVLAVIDRWRWTEVAWMAVASMILIYLYFQMADFSESKFAPASLETVESVAKFVLLYIGSPFIRLTLWPANVELWPPSGMLGNLFGVAILAIGATALALRIRTPRWGGPLVAAGLAFIGIAVATAIIAALSRSWIGPAEATNRKYAALTALAWCGSLFIVAEFLSVRWYGRVQTRPMVLASLATLALAIFIRASQTREFMLFEKWNLHLEESATSLWLNAHDDEYEGAVNFRPERARWINDVLLRPNRAAFYTSGNPMLNDVLDVTPRELECIGDFQIISTIPGGPAQASRAFRIQGWVWMKAKRESASSIVIVDINNRVRGLATMTRSAPIVDEFAFASLSKRVNAGFFGYVVSSGPGPYRALAFDTTKEDSCLIAEFRL